MLMMPLSGQARGRLMLMMFALPGPSRPGSGPTDADDALSGPSRPGRGPADADDARLAGFSRGPTDADDALVGALTPRKGGN